MHRALASAEEFARGLESCSVAAQKPGKKRVGLLSAGSRRPFLRELGHTCPGCLLPVTSSIPWREATRLHADGVQSTREH